MDRLTSPEDHPRATACGHIQMEASLDTLPLAQRKGGSDLVTPIRGIVKNGLIVPDAPLPEGVQVEIRLCDTTPEVPPDLQEELEAWQRASANALDLVERLAQEDAGHETR
jgi:hypothetical protein